MSVKQFGLATCLEKRNGNICRLSAATLSIENCIFLDGMERCLFAIDKQNQTESEAITSFGKWIITEHVSETLDPQLKPMVSRAALAAILLERRLAVEVEERDLAAAVNVNCWMDSIRLLEAAEGTAS